MTRIAPPKKDAKKIFDELLKTNKKKQYFLDEESEEDVDEIKISKSDYEEFEKFKKEQTELNVAPSTTSRKTFLSKQDIDNNLKKRLKDFDEQTVLEEPILQKKNVYDSLDDVSVIVKNIIHDLKIVEFKLEQLVKK